MVDGHAYGRGRGLRYGACIITGWFIIGSRTTVKRNIRNMHAAELDDGIGQHVKPPEWEAAVGNVPF
eukprot:601567-Prymnesium_polylepis.1